ncbi:MAG: (2Fe-2S)-binding protein [Sulfuritalea sp.]|nr:(2Fe-2S)-binding protein [Sulfuritalea sp.]
MSIQITIDGMEINTEEGRTLVEVAAENGVYIPTLCYLRNQSCLGTCRVCAVRVNGNISAGCTVRVGKDMVVEVNSAEVADMRKAIVEMLFAEGNHNCPSCEKSGRCQLQAVGYEVGMTVARFPYRFEKRPPEFAAGKIWLERDRCIFCQRCVNLMRDAASGKKIFSISNRGHRARIEIDVGLADAMPPEQVKQAVDLCPVGAILEKRIGYDEPIGQRKYEVHSLRERTLNTEGASS